MPNKPIDQTLSEVEEAQEALRDCIERTRGLTEEAERLVHGQRIEVHTPPNRQS